MIALKRWLLSACKRRHPSIWIGCLETKRNRDFVGTRKNKSWRCCAGFTHFLSPNSFEDLRLKTLHPLSSKPWRRGLKDLNTLEHLSVLEGPNFKVEAPKRGWVSIEMSLYSRTPRVCVCVCRGSERREKGFTQEWRFPCIAL